MFKGFLVVLDVGILDDQNVYDGCYYKLDDDEDKMNLMPQEKKMKK